MPTIKIHYFSDDLPRLQKTGKGDWIDLYAAQTMQLRAGKWPQGNLLCSSMIRSLATRRHISFSIW